MRKSTLAIFSLIAMTLGMSAFGDMHEEKHQGAEKGQGEEKGKEDEHRHRPDLPEQAAPQAEEATQKLNLDDALLFMALGLLKEHEEEKAPEPAKTPPAEEEKTE